MTYVRNLLIMSPNIEHWYDISNHSIESKKSNHHQRSRIMNQIELFISNGFWHAYYKCDGIREVIQTPFNQDASFEFVSEKIQAKNQGVDIIQR